MLTAPQPLGAIPATMPTTFASLPLEMRQKILLYSFREPYAQDRAFNINLSLLYATYHNGYPYYRNPIQAPYTYAWACLLKRTHPLIENDLGFVLKKALDEFGATMVSEIEMECEQKWDKHIRWWRMADPLTDSFTYRRWRQKQSLIWAMQDRMDELRSLATERLDWAEES
jgi:hypothetical protein